jgi:hypothetical protein
MVRIFSQIVELCAHDDDSWAEHLFLCQLHRSLLGTL